MKTTLHRVALISLAGALAFSSCRKKEIENTNDFIDQAKNNTELQANGSITATLSGNKKDYTNMSEEKYEFENKVFAYCNDNFQDESVVMSTQKISRSGYSYGNTYSYTVQDFAISMYATSQGDLQDKESNDRITISFKVYDGTLDPDLIKQSYTTGEPQEISISYAVTYDPNKEDGKMIDRVTIEGNISYDYVVNSAITTKKELVNITKYEFDEESGAISFEFDGVDSDDLDNKESAEGKVNTKILVNNLLPEKNDIYTSSSNSSSNSYDYVADVYYDAQGNYYASLYGSTIPVTPQNGSSYYYVDGSDYVYYDYNGAEEEQNSSDSSSYEL